MRFSKAVLLFFPVGQASDVGTRFCLKEAIAPDNVVSGRCGRSKDMVIRSVRQRINEQFFRHSPAERHLTFQRPVWRIC